MVTRNRVGLILLLCAVLVVTLLAQQSLQGAPVVQATPCFSQTKQGIVFELLGYAAQTDGSTSVRYRITNPGPRALDAVGFTAQGWMPVAPGDRADYIGALGDYAVRWALHNLIPSQEAWRFQPQGDWFKSGAAETFVLSVRNFDPQRGASKFCGAALGESVTRRSRTGGEQIFATFSGRTPLPRPA